MIPNNYTKATMVCHLLKIELEGKQFFVQDNSVRINEIFTGPYYVQEFDIWFKANKNFDSNILDWNVYFKVNENNEFKLINLLEAISMKYINEKILSKIVAILN